MTDRTFDALPDPADFRDQLFVPTLVEVPEERPLQDFLDVGVPILDQGQEGACTGFGLAAVANYLLRKRRVHPDETPVSPRMFYEMAKRYDEWEGEDYSGSSARGAMKGWHKHGVCADDLSPYEPEEDWQLTTDHSRDAVHRPLGAYFRVNPQDLVSLHTAIAEAGILFATARVHNGWKSPDENGHIEPHENLLGGHAFAIVGYTPEGLWIQNSWGTSWGRHGYGLLTYDDWLENAMDTWVARLGVPVQLLTANSSAITLSASAPQSQVYAVTEVRPHIISLGNEGRFRETGRYGTSEADVAATIEQIPDHVQSWSKPRLLLWSCPGFVDT